MKLAALLVSATLGAASPADTEITLTKNQAEMCEAGGGCALVTKDAFEAIIGQAFDKGVKEGESSCKGKI